MLLRRFANTMKGVIASQPGGPEVLQVAKVPIPELYSDEVRVRVAYSAVNRADVLQRMGKYPPPFGITDVLGLEAVGTVEETGQRVMALVPGGGNAEFVNIHKDLLVPIPDKMSFEDAAAIPEVWITAYMLIKHLGNIQPGQTVLIHAGASGVGTALIQLARHFGATPIVTSRTPAKLDFCASLGVQHTLGEQNFTEEIAKITSGRGVDLILDPVGATYFDQNMKCVASEGTWIVYGMMGGTGVPKFSLAKLVSKRVTLLGSTLRSRTLEYRTDLLSKFKKDKIMDYFNTGHFKPIIDSCYNLEDISEAHTHMGENKNIGKIILKVI